MTDSNQEQKALTEEQKYLAGIVEKFNDLKMASDSLTEIYQQKLNDLTELKQSNLKKAFSGELTQKAA